MPVQVYTASPINAASKASGITPKTEAAEGNEPHVKPSPSTTSSGSPTAYPPAQPGARPSLPVQTGVPESSNRYKPTSTQADTSPPPPQPGAVPSPPGNSHLPPPPKAGEPIQQRPRSQTMPMPPQMLYPSPATTYQTHQRGTSTSVSTAYSPNVPQPTFLQSSESTEPDFSHPPGYQQNIHAADFTRDQREAHNASFGGGSYENYDEEDSIWNTAKKWAAAAGDSLAAAEHEVWKRINKE
ncbi:uncharacterized protein TRIVIDRAFT_38580 [Trichoderma virens Gv29-8]|uniref:Uncharacterized protein n=1 Tax=Hypocrea virens (strain Gv29-8 / FGSC 10586) TaxID=413071 RepID=G9ND43_HYPVG|nr:uncharacterized protein TRIVIDRAFT_38580 [Trichoderma virens Gv29-8]EHK15612.1 hypothetical protein TRIVIDRAFT_38580 [Trichoderma virens Gv29-8]UKZ51557.1 hypothetical protein TrVGV298_005317 [Trichoderma virens]